MLVLSWETIKKFCSALEKVPSQYVEDITRMVGELSECAQFEEHRKQILSDDRDLLKEQLQELSERMRRLEKLAEENMESQYKEFLEKENKL